MSGLVWVSEGEEAWICSRSKCSLAAADCRRRRRSPGERKTSSSSLLGEDI